MNSDPTVWSLSNIFTSSFEELERILQFRATAKLSQYLDARLSRRFGDAP
jgi:hypothetical protein